MPFAAGPVLAYVGRGKYATVGPTEYVGSDDVITIPSDFRTDLATVPRIFWALIPPQGAYEQAAVLHDWLCVRLRVAHQYGQQPTVSSRDADGLFRRVMREGGVGFITRWVMWTGVRWGALFNPCRRKGFWRDAPLVGLLTALGLAVTGLLVYGLDAAVHAIWHAL